MIPSATGVAGRTHMASTSTRREARTSPDHRRVTGADPEGTAEQARGPHWCYIAPWYFVLCGCYRTQTYGNATALSYVQAGCWVICVVTSARHGLSHRLYGRRVPTSMCAVCIVLASAVWACVCGVIMCVLCTIII